MKTIDRNEVLPIGEYELIRPHFRARVIQEKRTRHVTLGEHMYANFENRDSVLLQVQEMLRTERITSESGIAHEIETYNELIPGDGQLSFTLFIAIADRETRERVLTELAGLERHVALEVDGVLYPAAQKLPPGARDDRTTAVHYFKVLLPAEARERMVSKEASVALVVNHPRYGVKSALGAATLAQLADDLAPS